VTRRIMTGVVVLTLVCSVCFGAQGTAKKKAKARRKPHPALVKVKDVPGLPRVLLIGDSISMGYTVPTRKLLKGKANLHRILENGGPTIRGLAKLSKWLGKKRWDVIHFNWGLHDLKVMPDGKHQVPIDQYEKNLTDLVKRLKATGAKLIWASTTPVPDKTTRPPRSNEQVMAYNAVAKKIMDANKIPIDDLYAFALPQLEQIQRPKNVHFTEKGSAVLARQVAASILAALGKPGIPGPGASAADEPDYLKVVRVYADTMITHGRDTYGTVTSPLFAATLDRKTLKLPVGAVLARITKIPHSQWGIRPNDRTLTGANPMHDLNLYQVLYALTKITGDARYAAEADKALKWFFEHCQSTATGIFAWGEHLGWDFNVDAPQPGRDTHEFYRPWVLWDRSFRLAPEPCQRFAVGLWRHQIADHDKGLFSRHAKYSKHGPGKGTEFPRHGGFYIATWAAAFERSKDPELLEAIRVLVDGFESRRNQQTGVIPSATSHAHILWPPSNLSLAIDLWDGAKKVPADLAAKMRACASKTDQFYLKLCHDLSPAGRGFLGRGSTSTLTSEIARGHNSYTDTWATGYGEATDAQMALLCLMRYGQVKLEGYKKLAAAAGERYLKKEPNTSIALYPGAMGDAIILMLALHRLTGDARYLARAEAFGKTSVAIFFEGSPLPRASSKHDHYEAITRGDTLAMALLDLWAARNKPKMDPGFVYPER